MAAWCLNCGAKCGARKWLIGCSSRRVQRVSLQIPIPRFRTPEGATKNKSTQSSGPSLCRLNHREGNALQQPTCQTLKMRWTSMSRSPRTSPSRRTRRPRASAALRTCPSRLRTACHGAQTAKPNLAIHADHGIGSRNTVQCLSPTCRATKTSWPPSTNSSIRTGYPTFSSTARRALARLRPFSPSPVASTAPTTCARWC